MLQGMDGLADRQIVEARLLDQKDDFGED